MITSKPNSETLLQRWTRKPCLTWHKNALYHVRSDQGLVLGREVKTGLDLGWVAWRHSEEAAIREASWLERRRASRGEQDGKQGLEEVSGWT